MIIFIINYISILIYGFFYLLKPTQKCKIIITFIITIQLIFLLGFRKYNINTDTLNYYFLYSKLELGDYSSFWGDGFSFSNEYVYKLLNFLAWKLGFTFQTFLFFVAILEIIPFSIFIYKNSNNFITSFVILLSFSFYFYSFITIRQFLAYGLMLLNVENVFKRKWLKFFIVVLISSQIHISSLFFIPAFFLFRLKPSFKTITTFFIIGVLFLLFRKTIITFIINGLFPSYQIIETTSIAFLLFNMFIFLCCLFIYNYYHRSLGLLEANSGENQNNSYFLMCFLTGILLMVFCTITDNALRIAQFYSIFIIIVIPNCVNYLDKKTQSLVYPMVYIILAIVFLKTMDSISANMPQYVAFWM